MSERARDLRNGVFCCLVFLGCYLLAWPVANMGFMDDWSYIESARVFADTGRVAYNGWATAMLGWMIPWGALFIKLFGFSFMVVKLSTLPVALGCLLLFYAILRRFEITSQNAVIGTLMLGLSPLFLPLSASFMTDIPGLFAILLCLNLCQLALAARTDRAAICWLAMAAGTNVVGGAARQIAWLGVLVMVPSAGWLMCKRRKVFLASLVLWAISAGTIFYFMRWFAKQPYSISMPISPVHAKTILLGLLEQIYTADLMSSEFLVLLLGIAPLLIIWLSRFGKRREHWVVLFCFGALPLLIFRLLFGKYAEIWPPVLIFSELPRESDFHLGTRMTHLYAFLWYFSEAAISLFLIAGLLGLVIAIREHRQKRGPAWYDALPKDVYWLLGPFSVGYILLLLTLGWQWIAFERYVIGLVPCAIIVALSLHQYLDRNKLPKSLIFFLVLFAAGAVAGTHDWFARQRARLEAIQSLRAAGVSRTEIDGGWEYDGWTQVGNGGYVNDPRIKIPANAYRPNANKPTAGICPVGSPIVREFTALKLKYVVETETNDCTVPTRYPDVHYLAWLPPFWRTIKIERIRGTMADTITGAPTGKVIEKTDQVENVTKEVDQ
jgi:hypothetical protein